MDFELENMQNFVASVNLFLINQDRKRYGYLIDEPYVLDEEWKLTRKGDVICDDMRGATPAAVGGIIMCNVVTEE